MTTKELLAYAVPDTPQKSQVRPSGSKLCLCGKRISANKQSCWACETASHPDAMEQFEKHPERVFANR